MIVVYNTDLVISDLFLCLELLLYAKPISLMVVINNIYGGIFYQMYFLPQLTVTFFKPVTV